MALRTSPTNIGLQLLATVSACDLGFVTLDDMTSRLELAFRSLERMRRFRGHFYNWYDLRDLQRARAGLRLHGGQRQPGRAPDRAPAGVSRAGGRAGIRRTDLARARNRSGTRRGAAAGAPGGGGRRAPPGGPRDARDVAARARLERGAHAPGPAASRRRGGAHRRGAPGRIGGTGGRVDLLEPAAGGGAERLVGRARRAAVRHPARARRHLGRRGRTRGPSPRDRGAGLRLRHGSGFPLPVRRRAEAVLHRLPAGHARAGRVVLRSARVRGPARELRRHRQERRPGRALVPARPDADLRRGGAGAGVVERQHVRVPDAGARDALLPVHHPGPDLRRGARRGRWPTAPSAECRGA